jgi:site-specific recombinase XerD
LENVRKKAKFDEQVGDFIDFVRKNNYHAFTVRKYCRNTAIIKSLLESRNILEYSSDACAVVVKEIMGESDYSLLSREKKEIIRCANAMLEYLLSGHVSFRSARKSKALNGLIGETISEYLDCRRTFGLSERTLEGLRQYLQSFQDYLETHSVLELQSMTGPILLEYIRHLTFSTKATIHCTLSALRGFLRHIYETSLVGVDWSYLLPKDNYKKEARLPSTYSRNEIEQILKAVDRGNSKGKRDFAMVLLAVRLGLRASDICGLKFENLLWEQNLLVLVQAKTQKRVSLPLLPEAGNAIIEYLKYGRPESDEPFIFLHQATPFERLQSPTLHSIVTALMKRADIKDLEDRKHGPHALRHSLAGAMLEQKTPLPVISEALGHSNIESTKIYLRIDISALRQCALDVPPSGNGLYGSGSNG